MRRQRYPLFHTLTGKARSMTPITKMLVIQSKRTILSTKVFSCNIVCLFNFSFFKVFGLISFYFLDFCHSLKLQHRYHKSSYFIQFELIAYGTFRGQRPKTVLLHVKFDIESLTSIFSTKNIQLDM